MNQTWPREGERTLRHQLLDRIDRRHWSAGCAKQHHVSSRAKHIESFIKSCLADAVINHMYAFVVCQALGLSFKILVGVKDNFVGASLASQFGLFFRSSRANHARANVLGHL